MNDSTGLYGFNSNSLLDSITPQLFAGTVADIPAGGSIVVQLEEDTIFNPDFTNAGKDVRFVGIGELDAYKPTIIDKPEDNYIVIDEEHQLNLYAGGVTDVNWSSSNNLAATIDVTTGLITGIGVGETVITATSKDNTDIFDTYNLTVKDKVVTINQSNYYIAIDGTRTVTATTRPVGDVKWSVDDTTIATIDEETGVITPVSGGTFNAIATYVGSEHITGTFEFEVLDELYPGLEVDFDITNPKIDIIADIGMETLGKMSEGYYTGKYDDGYNFDNSFTGVTINQTVDLTLIDHTPICYGVTWSHYGEGWLGNSFKGIYNGNGNIIAIKSLNSIFNSSANGNSHMGIFAVNSGVINDINIILDGTTIKSDVNNIGLVCSVNQGLISNPIVTIQNGSSLVGEGSIASYVGGICALAPNHSTTYINSSIESPIVNIIDNSFIEGNSNVGGIIASGFLNEISSPSVKISNNSYIKGSSAGGIATYLSNNNNDLGVINNPLNMTSSSVIIENNSYIEGGSVGGITTSGMYLNLDNASVILKENSHLYATNSSAGLVSSIYNSEITGDLYIHISKDSSICTSKNLSNSSALICFSDMYNYLGKQNPSDEMQITLEIYGDIIASNGTAGGLVSNYQGYLDNNYIFPKDEALLPDISITIGPNANILNGDGTKGALFYDDSLLDWENNPTNYTGSRDTFVYAVPYGSEYVGFTYDDSTSNRIEYPHEDNPTPSIPVNDLEVKPAINTNDQSDPNGVFIKANDLASKSLIIDTDKSDSKDVFTLTNNSVQAKNLLPDGYYDFSLVADSLPINVPAYFATEDLLNVLIDGVDDTVVYDNHFEAYSSFVDGKQDISITFEEFKSTDWNIYRMEYLTDIFDYGDDLSVLSEITPTITQVDDDTTLVEFSIDVDGLYAIEAHATSKYDPDRTVQDIKYIYLGQEVQLPAEPVLPDDLEFSITPNNSNTTLHNTEELANTNAVASNTTQSVEIFADNGSITTWTLFKDGKNITDDVDITEDKQVETHSIKFSVSDDGLYKVVGTGVSLYDEDDTSTITKYFTINEPTKELVLDISATCTLYDTENSVVSVEGDQSVTITATNGYIDDFTIYRNDTEITVQYNAVLDSNDRFTTLEFTVSDDGVYKVVANAKSDNGQSASDTKYLKIESTPLTPVISLNITGSNIESTSSSAENNPALNPTAVTISAKNDDIKSWKVTLDGSDITTDLTLTTDTDIVKLFTLVDDGLYVITATTDTGVASTKYLCIENPVAPPVSLSITGNNVENSSANAEKNPATNTTAITISSSNDYIKSWNVTKDGSDISSSLTLNYDTDKLKMFNLIDDGLYVITATTDTGVTDTKYLCIETPIAPVVSLSITGSNIESSSSSATNNPTTSSVVTISASNDNITSWSVTNDGSDVTSIINLTSDSDTLKVFALSNDGLYVITATTDTGVTITRYLYIQTPIVTPPTISLNISGENVYTSQSSAESNPATSSRIVTITSTNDDIYSWSISKNGVDITDSVTIYTNNSDEKILYLNQSGLYKITATTDSGSISSTKYLNISITNYTNPFLEIQGRHVMFTENEALNNPTQTRETVVVFCENGYINDVAVYVNNNLVNINYEQNHSNYKVFSLSNPGLYTINAFATSNATVSIATENGSLIRDLSIKPLSFINATSSTPSTISRTKYLYITEPIVVPPAIPPTQEFVNVTYIANEGGLINGYNYQNIPKYSNTATVTAVALEGYQFQSWSDGLTNAVRIDYSVDSDKTVFAIFIKIGSLTDPPQTGSKLVIAIKLFMFGLILCIIGATTLIIKKYRKLKR